MSAEKPDALIMPRTPEQDIRTARDMLKRERAAWTVPALAGLCSCQSVRVSDGVGVCVSVGASSMVVR